MRHTFTDVNGEAICVEEAGIYSVANLATFAQGTSYSVPLAVTLAKYR